MKTSAKIVRPAIAATDADLRHQRYHLEGIESPEIMRGLEYLPATLKNADPDTPSKNRATSIVAMFGATAQGINHMRKKRKETIYIGLLP